MGDATATQLGAYAGYISLAIAIGGMVVGVFNHKRITSACCGRVASVSLDIDNTTPKGGLKEKEGISPPTSTASNATVV
jgi:hypothetical protein